MFRHCSTALLLVLSLAGCSQKFKDVNDTVNLAFFGDQDVALNAEEISQLPYASLYARVDDGPQAFMVLAFAENRSTLGLTHHSDLSSTITAEHMSTQLKWVSADKGMLITESGRIVKTLNLPAGNLVSSDSYQPDPLALGLHLASTPTQWQRTIDWQPGYHFGYPVKSQFVFVSEETLDINGTNKLTKHFVEHVSIPTLNIEYNNHWWIEPNNGMVIKSKQKLAPNLPYIELTLLKPFA
ncbi:YjbF family lipoprotein [Photobacterium sp. DA100]|uniref:YjbF family lipoprotein n=1 Tax=Photobacterium sp. DA100 TaxID=3027472 RepID=UPI00247A8E26|nr:YjbF family lipoprotein [Photobacterium sp. DA100]WEM41582.1 YjbF family lipoprotein [Photobacterium sp. DA100]